MTRRDTNQDRLPLSSPGADQLEPFFAFLDRRRNALLALAAGLFITIALLDWLVFQDISVGALYVFPILLVAAFLRPVQILPLAAACSVLRELFSPLHWHPGYGARLVSWWCAFSAIGIFVGVLARNRQVVFAIRGRCDSAEMRTAGLSLFPDVILACTGAPCEYRAMAPILLSVEL